MRHINEVAHQLVNCDFCRDEKSISYRIVKTWPDVNLEGGREKQVDIYPPRGDESDVTTGTKFRSRATVVDLPPLLRKVYEEVTAAYDANLFTLCSVGLRALVEGICADCEDTKKVPRVYPKRELGLRVQELGIRHLIPKDLAEAFRAHNLLGNDAVYQLITPGRDEIKLAIELIETAFDNIFSVARRHSDLGGMMSERIGGNSANLPSKNR